MYFLFISLDKATIRVIAIIIVMRQSDTIISIINTMLLLLKGQCDSMILQAVKFVIDQLQCYVQLHMKVNINSCPL